jgi:hypothetical protein
LSFFCELPDKFVRRGSRSFETGPDTTGRMTMREGGPTRSRLRLGKFNLNKPIKASTFSTTK